MHIDTVEDPWLVNTVLIWFGVVSRWSLVVPVDACRLYATFIGLGVIVKESFIVSIAKESLIVSISKERLIVSRYYTLKRARV
jgi:hypothetical protein